MHQSRTNFGLCGLSQEEPTCGFSFTFLSHIKEQEDKSVKADMSSYSLLSYEKKCLTKPMTVISKSRLGIMINIGAKARFPIIP